ncbi:peptide synthase [Planctomycetales bacterium]|nr:peptide synthase [Planctomycetales bacterium]
MNIASRLQALAQRLPTKRAVVDRRSGRTLTFQQLDRLSGEYARALNAYGLRRGDKTLLMVKPSPDFFALVFALFKIGAPPVMLDPGMGVARLLHCIQQAAPTALVGVPLAHLTRVLRPRFFASVKINVTVGRKFFWRGATLSALHRASAPEPLPPVDAAPDELAAVLFTTGSTGPAKGVEYTHRIFLRQCAMIGEIYGVTENDVDLACYPLFALFSVGLGMTAVIPKMNAARPAAANPRELIAAINAERCTFSFGSPTLWRKVAEDAAARKIRLPSLRQVLMSGCPVPPRTHEILLRQVLPAGAETHAPYGATESLPVCDLAGSAVLNETAAATRQGRGYCVGAPVGGVELKIIEWRAGGGELADAKILPVGAVGEIIVRGENVTRAYHRLPDATARAKIRDGETFWHRLGDVGYLDERGRVWYCGRAAHRVETADGVLYSVCCEAIFNEHPLVRRSALIGLGVAPRQTPAIVIEPVGRLSAAAQKKLTAELLAAAQKYEPTRAIARLFFCRALPVDIRHNAKINREKLRERYEEPLKIEN